MRKSKNKRFLFISLLLTAIVVLVIGASSYIKGDKIESKNIGDTTVVESLVEKRLISINELISNDLSSSDFTQEKLDADIEKIMARWELKGGSFALMRNDSLIYAKGYGVADEMDSVFCDASHVFRLASVSKLITATAIMKLCEQGKLSLESLVYGEKGILNDSIFSNLRTKSHKKIKVEHLLRHTAGYATPDGDAAFNLSSTARRIKKQLPLSLDDMVEYSTRIKLRTVPGGSYHYSNLGYVVLTKIIEQVTDMEYETYVKDSILIPAGCYDMHIGKSYDFQRRHNEVAYFEVKEADPIYSSDGSNLLVMKSAGGNDISLLSGAGGWIASAPEILRFVASINNYEGKRDILKPETIDIMTAYSNRGRPIGWASTGRYEWIRTGHMAGTTAIIKRQRNGYTWIFVSNSSAWIGPNVTKILNSTITRSLSKIKEWPSRDLFEEVRN